MSVPNPEPGLGDVVGDEQVDALAAELVGGALERPGLGREPDEDRARVGAARAVGAPSLSSPWAIRAISARRSGVASSSRVSAVAARRACVSAGATGRKSATAAAMTRASKPARPSGAWVVAQERGAQVGGRLDPDDGRARSGSGDLDVRGDERDPRAAVERGLGDRRRPSARSSDCR